MPTSLVLSKQQRHAFKNDIGRIVGEDRQNEAAAARAQPGEKESGHARNDRPARRCVQGHMRVDLDAVDQLYGKPQIANA